MEDGKQRMQALIYMYMHVWTRSSESMLVLVAACKSEDFQCREEMAVTRIVL